MSVLSEILSPAPNAAGAFEKEFDLREGNLAERLEEVLTVAPNAAVNIEHELGLPEGHLAQKRY